MPPVTPRISARQTLRIKRVEGAILERVRITLLSSAVHPTAPGALSLPLTRDALAAAGTRAMRHISALAEEGKDGRAREAARGLLAGRPAPAQLRRRSSAKEESDGESGGESGASKPSRLQAGLYLDELKCVRRTHRFAEIENGFDEIHILGIVLDCDTGATYKVHEDLGKWTDGRRRTYPEPLRVLDLSVATLPNSAEALLFLCDDDPGEGMSAFLTALYETVLAEVEEELEGAEEDGATEEEAPEDPPDEEPWWLVLLRLVLLLLMWYIGFARRDDVFAADPMQLTSPSFGTAGQIGSAIGPRTNFRVTQYGADYRAKLHWALKAS